MPEKTIAAKSKYNQTISDIMLLNYVEKFKPYQVKFQEFWKKYHIYDVPAEIKKLISYGLVTQHENSYELTKEGKAEVKANDFVMYYHKTKVTCPPIMNVLWMNEQLKKYPKHRYRDLIWGEFNRLSAVAMERAHSGSSNRQYIYYRLDNKTIRILGVFQ